MLERICSEIYPYVMPFDIKFEFFMNPVLDVTETRSGSVQNRPLLLGLYFEAQGKQKNAILHRGGRMYRRIAFL